MVDLWHARSHRPGAGRLSCLGHDLSDAGPRRRAKAARACSGAAWRALSAGGGGGGAGGGDDAVLAQAAAVARTHAAQLLVIHVVEGFGAEFHGPEAADQESRSDREKISALATHLRSGGLSVESVLGYGNPADELVRIAGEHGLDLLVLGTHGHRFLADLALGRTVSPLLHRLTIPVLVVPSRADASASPKSMGGSDG